MKYLSSICLLVATLMNVMVQQYYSEDPLMWYHLTHKLQIGLILISSLVFVDNNINKWALIGYLLCHLLNWLLYFFDGDYNTWIVSGVGYSMSMMVILIIEKWKE